MEISKGVQGRGCRAGFGKARRLQAHGAGTTPVEIEVQAQRSLRHACAPEKLAAGVNVKLPSGVHWMVPEPGGGSPTLVTTSSLPGVVVKSLDVISIVVI